MALRRWALTLLLALLAPAAFAEAALEARDAWVREGPPNTPVLGGFMELHNHSDEPVTVTAISSPQFERIEMHLSEQHQGMAQMTAQPGLTVPAKGSLSLAPGGYHLMLFGPAGALRAGAHVELTLHTAAHGTLSVHAEVRRLQPPHGHHAH